MSDSREAACLTSSHQYGLQRHHRCSKAGQWRQDHRHAQPGRQVAQRFSTIDEGSTVNFFGMLAFHVNSKAFGSANSPDQPDNGIDFSSVRLEVLPK